MGILVDWVVNDFIGYYKFIWWLLNGLLWVIFVCGSTENGLNTTELPIIVNLTYG